MSICRASDYLIWPSPRYKWRNNIKADCILVLLHSIPPIWRRQSPFTKFTEIYSKLELYIVVSTQSRTDGTEGETRRVRGMGSTLNRRLAHFNASSRIHTTKHQTWRRDVHHSSENQQLNSSSMTLNFPSQDGFSVGGDLWGKLNVHYPPFEGEGQKMVKKITASAISVSIIL